MRVMIFMIVESLKNLVSLVCLLVAIIYVFSICFTMAATEYLREPPDGPDEKKWVLAVDTYYSSVILSMYTCFKGTSPVRSYPQLLSSL